mmetsp:Transcript_6418/g.9589  ORF Transcript_6418/g.9589 Transcript_6418/m.9589 type:complete len:212 (+) Transcript_6418:580-1215(+)
MIIPRGHVRVPKILLELGIGALASANQPDRTTAHVRPLGALPGELFNRQVPVTVCPALLIKPDSEEHECLNPKIGTQLNQNSPDIGFGKIGQPNVAIQESAEFRGPHFASHLASFHKKYRRITIGCLVGRHHCTFSKVQRLDTTRQNTERCSIRSWCRPLQPQPPGAGAKTQADRLKAISLARQSFLHREKVQRFVIVFALKALLPGDCPG